MALRRKREAKEPAPDGQPPAPAGWDAPPPTTAWGTPPPPDQQWPPPPATDPSWPVPGHPQQGAGAPNWGPSPSDTWATPGAAADAMLVDQATAMPEAPPYGQPEPA